MNIRVQRALIAGGILIAGTIAEAHSQSVDKFESVRSEMRRFVDSGGAPSVAVSVAKDGKIVWEEAIGWADRERAIRATPNTMYALASVSKSLTATGIMVLVERGKIDLDAPTNKYLGSSRLTGLAGNSDGATIRRVLSHTAGLPLHSQIYYGDREYAPPPMEETIRRYGILVYPPGEIYGYANLGYGILDYVISRVSGKSYHDFMRDQVFLPLGLTHTAVDISPALEGVAARGYDANQRPLPGLAFDHAGASAIYSSAHDLVRFAMFHLKDHLADQRAILKDENIDLMHRVVPPAIDYGLGFTVRDGGTRLAHTGGMPGASTLMILYPQRNVALVVLSNTSTSQTAVMQEFAIAREVGVALFPGDASVAVRGPVGAPGQGATPFAPNPELVGNWAGTLRTWQQTVTFRLTIAADGTATAQIGDQPPATLANVSFHERRLFGNFAAIMPTDDAHRWPHSLSLGLLLSGRTLRGEVDANSNADRIYFTLASYADLTKR